MAKDPSFPFYASDWLGSTKRAMMTPAQRGAYIDLLAHQWGDETCSLEDDEGLLAVLSGLGNESWKGSSRVLHQCFPPHPTMEGRIANPRLLELRTERDEWREKCRVGGENSGKKRRENAVKATAYDKSNVNEDILNHSSSVVEGYLNTPSPSPSPSPSSTKPPPALELSAEEFAEVAKKARELVERARELLARWNATPGLKAARKMNGDRTASLHARMASDTNWWPSVPIALERISKSSFCRGGGNRKWVADIDWFLRTESMTKILEGKYDDKPTSHGHRNRDGRPAIKSIET